MKTILKTFVSYGTIGLLMLSACKKEGALVTSNGGKPGTLTASATTLILDKTRLNDTSAAITFSFTAPNYGYAAAVTNTLEIDAPGDNWKNPTSVTLGTKAYAQSYSTSSFNNLLLKLNLAGGSASQVDVRVVHSISANVTPVYSNVLSLIVTPFNLSSFIYIAGGYNLYTPANADSLLSATSNNVYVGVIPFTAGSGADGNNAAFKIILNKQNFNGNYGYGATVSTNPTTETVVESLSTAGSAGNLFANSLPTVDPNVNITSNYAIVDLNKNTITLTPISWGIVGSATPGSWPNSTGFQDDIDMHYNNATQTWSVVATLTGGNQIKFRENHAWNLDYGSVTTPGVLDTQNNNNITVPTTGSYLVTIDLNHLTYSLVKQ